MASDKIIKLAEQLNAGDQKNLSRDDFYCYMEMSNAFIFVPTRKIWPASSVNARVLPVHCGNEVMKPSQWLAKYRPADQMTWAPGEPMLVEGRVVSGAGWKTQNGTTCFNLYEAPVIKPGDASQARPWLDLLFKVFPSDAGHIICWLAHRVQHPDQKINHALVLIGAQGIGKDTLLEPLRHAVGPWNFEEISPPDLLQRYNAYLKSVILRVNEAHDLGDQNRYDFYERLKTYITAPPNVVRIDEKHIRQYCIPNVTGVVITTNHRIDGIYLPAGDRRHYVARSELMQANFSEDCWNGIYRWYENGGFEHVAAYLQQVDLCEFDPKKPPKKTEAFWDIVSAGQEPEDDQLAEIFEKLGNPDVTTLVRVQNEAKEDLKTWLRDRNNRRKIPHRMETCGYIRVKNPAREDGCWAINGERQTIYAKKTLPQEQRIAAAQTLCGRTPLF